MKYPNRRLFVEACLVGVVGAMASGAVPVPFVYQRAQTTQAARELPSAHRALLTALEVLRESTAKDTVELFRVEAKSVPGTDEKAAHVAVELDLAMHAAGGAAAEQGFTRIETAVAARAHKPNPEPVDYSYGVENLMGLPYWSAASDTSPSGSHRAVVTGELPAEAVPGSRTSFPESAVGAAAANGEWPTYIRSIAARQNVEISSLVISQRRSESQGDAPVGLWTVKPRRPSRGEGARTYSLAQVVSFLYLLENDRPGMTITQIEIEGVDGTDVQSFSLTLRAQ